MGWTIDGKPATPAEAAREFDRVASSVNGELRRIEMSGPWYLRLYIRALTRLVWWRVRLQMWWRQS
jgi:hypothetical protein